MARLSQQALSFAGIGAIGFVVDGGIMTLLNSGFGLSVVRARLVSFSFAVTLTWFLNRHSTFAQSKSGDAGGEWGRYALVNGLGALLNLGVFLWLIREHPLLAGWPILALAIAAALAMIFNFLASRRLVFRAERS